MFSVAQLKTTPAIALFAVALIGSASGALHQPVQAADGPRCEIRVANRAGASTIEGVVLSAVAIAGSYHLIVKSSGDAGRSHIDQSGEFSAKPGEMARFGQVSLGGTPSGYTADLTITWSGGSSRCSQHTDGKI